MNGDIVTLPNGLEAMEWDGHLRVLAKLPPDEQKRKMMATYSMGTIPQSEWRETNRRPAFGDEFVLDQKSHGSCVGFGSVGALMKARAMRNMSFQRLSGAFVYSKINGGQDNGAVISDSLGALEKYGTCLDSEAPWDAIYPNRIPAGASATAKRFRLTKGETINSWADFISALIMGYVCPTAVMVGNSFNNLDGDGVVGFDRGPGNHCTHFFDVFKTTAGQWAAWGTNSWNTTWGRRGYFAITQKHFEGVQQDCYRIETETEDPNDTSEPPPVK